MTAQQNDFDRAVAFHRSGRFAEAETIYQEILRHQPGHAPAIHMLGTIAVQTGRGEAGVELIRQSIALVPNAIAYSNLAAGLNALGRSEEALDCARQAIALQPNMADAYNACGNAHLALRQLEDALTNFDKAIRLRPGYAEAFANRANALNGLRRHEEALASSDNAIALQPSLALAFNGRGTALRQLSRHDEALAAYEIALALRDEFPEAHSNRANVLADLRCVDQALAGYRKAVTLKPDYAEAHLNMAFLLLRAGCFEEGFRAFEWRHLLLSDPAQAIAEPQWRGATEISGKTLLVHAEQGLGDTLHFCRFLAPLQARGGRIILAAPEMLLGLLKTLRPGVELVRLGDPPPPFDVQCPLMSLPLALGTTLATIPANIPYLAAEPDRVERWKRRLGGDGFRVGISWRGSTANPDVERSFPLGMFHGISRLPGIRLVSLQKYEGLKQLADLPDGMKVETLGEDYDAGPNAFLDCAAVMANLDLVITCDTSVAHLAGALARPTWIALKFVADWRWQSGRSDSPWYPTVRLFRQPVRGDWPGAFREIEAALATHATSPAAPSDHRRAGGYGA